MDDTVLKTLHLAGFDFSSDNLKRTGGEIHREKYRFKIREGFSQVTCLPKRIFETPSPLGKLDEEFIHNAVEHFRKEILKAIP